ncbi:MAG: ABC transporter permease subunit [Thaumarchaeota archaeon]|nr:ABC transporter permease subunit [Nitrososphaerota archaeon]
MMPNLLIIGLATLATIGRTLALIGLSILTGWILAWLAVKSRAFENAYVPVVNALESIPVLAFLPIVLVVFVSRIGGTLGVEISSDFLVFDAVAWNIWIGIYQAFKTVPENLLEVSENYRLGSFRTLRFLYIPHSIPRISSNIFSSFADAFFYISVSEIFSITVQGHPVVYKTFGIGTIISLATQTGDFATVEYSLLFIAIGVVVMTALISIFSKRAVAKYGVDTVGEIHRRTRRYEKWLTFRRQREQISKYTSRVTLYQRRHRLIIDELDKSEGRSSMSRAIKWVALSVGVLIVAYLIYSSLILVFSVPAQQWITYLTDTPFLLYNMAVDYVRVAIITSASLALAITLGYYMATHRRASAVLAPLMQVIAAFPAPTYFPLIFIFTLPFLSAALPFLYVEVYIFILGFLSCFYYIFFDFWIGIQAIPSEFWEVMRNHEIGLFTRMRRIILPATFPYLITGLSSTINSCWAGLAIGEFWVGIDGKHNLIASVGMMKYIGQNLSNGNVGAAAWVSLLFAVVVIIYGLLFTRNLMDLARKKYVVEEGIYAA